MPRMWTLILLSACTDDTRGVSGVVKDIWGKAVPEATVVVEGLMERHYTDDKGRFDLELPADQLVMHVEDDGSGAPVDPLLVGPSGIRVLVGKEGFIKQMDLAKEVPEEEDFSAVQFNLYPEPEGAGFYAVGASSYVQLGQQRIQMVGTDLAHYSGIQDIPEESLPAGPVKLVFTTRLRTSEIAQMNLHLSKLEFVNKGKVKGIFGVENDTVNLWVAKDDVPFDIVGFDTREDYLITSREPLAAGMYAFHAHDILHEDDERILYSLPKEQQVAFPFEVR